MLPTSLEVRVASWVVRVASWVVRVADLEEVWLWSETPPVLWL